MIAFSCRLKGRSACNSCRAVQAPDAVNDLWNAILNVHANLHLYLTADCNMEDQ